MKQTYQGSCHCGRVRFEVDADLDLGTTRCNCSMCSKTRYWGVTVAPADFRLLSGEEDLGDYRFNTMVGQHRFCRNCGVKTHGQGHVEELGGDFVSINVAALDGLEPAQLAALPITYTDGRHDAWWNVPAETRYL